MGLAVYRWEPSSAAIRGLLERVFRTVGRQPRHLISDQGTQFTARGFRQWCRRRRIGHRFGAVGKYGSLAVIERCIRTFKADCTRRLTLVPYHPADIRQELALYVCWYNSRRPHTWLGGATPVRFATAGAGQAGHLASSPVRVGRGVHFVPLHRSSCAYNPGHSSNSRSATTPDVEPAHHHACASGLNPIARNPFPKWQTDSLVFSNPVGRRGGASRCSGPDRPDSLIRLRLGSGFVRPDSRSEWRTRSHWPTSAGHDHSASTNFCTASLNICGCCRLSRWPESGRRRNREPLIPVCMISASFDGMS